MASIFISTNERTNFARMCWIVVDVFRDILWRVLVDEISPADLPSKVRTNQHKLGNLNKDIKSWLCNSSSASPIIPTSKDLDVTSLYTLIRNLCNLVPVPTNGWGGAPPPTGGNLGDDVERVRVFRNSVYGHAKEGYVNTIDFSDLCREMKTFVTSLDAFFGGNCDFVGRINSILTCSMDKALQDTYIDKMQEIAKLSDEVSTVKELVGRIENDLRDHDMKVSATTSERRKIESSLKRGLETLEGRVESLEKESIETRKEWDSLRKERKPVINEMEQQRIIDSSQRILQQHRCHAEKNFIQTRAYIHANEILRQHRRLIITGKSGQGKSYMANQLLIKIIADDPNVKPLILTTVEQWKRLVDVSVRFGIIVDDMCGKICLNEGELMKWREESTYMQTLIENGRHVVIFTMKSYFNENILVTMQSCPLFSTEIILNLDNIKLKFAEKNEFANIYFKEYALSADEVSTICKTDETTVGFPQLCKAAGMIKDKSKLFGLFSKPREMILEQINHFRLDDKMTYGCLVLVLLSKGRLNIQSIRELANDREKKENIAFSIFISCGIPHVVPLKVLDTLRSLQGTYLSFDPSEKSYSFGHDSIEDAVFCSYLEFFPEETLHYCPLQLICKRCTIKYDSNDIQKTQDNTLILHPSCQAHLINRITTALRECSPTDFRIVSEANIWTCENFTKAFLAEFKEIHCIADKENNSLLVHAANAHNRDLVDKLLYELDNIPGDKRKNVSHFLTKSAQASCAHKDTYLIEKICKGGRVDVNDILPNSIQHGSVDAIEFLLESGADIKYRSKKGENLLHIACLNGRLDLVNFLHSKQPNLMNEFDGDGRSVGHSVAVGGRVEILEFLLTLGLNPMYTDQTGWNLLHYACWHRNKAMAEHLAGKYSKLLYSDTNEGLSVLICAAFGGSINMFSNMYHLMDQSLNVDKNIYTNMTNNVQYLTRKTNDQQTLLHMSCLGGSLEMTKYLKQTYPTMLHEVDNMKKTPAHYAAQIGNIALLSYLIDCGTDPWCKTSEKETLLHRACINGQLEMSKHLVKTYSTMLHDVDNMRRTPAHKVAYNGNIDLLSYLIDCGTDPWCKTSEDETLLHRACTNGQLEMSKHLVQTYPKMLHEVDNKTRTPAHNAAHSGNIALLSYLIDCGTDPWCKTSEEETLLHRACIHGQLEMSKHLVQTYPTMLHKVDNETSTPAHYAAESGNIALLSNLIDCGTDPWCKTSEEETLLHRACMRGKLEMSKHLVQTYPTMLHEVDNKTRTPAHNAAHSGNIALLSYLIDCGTDPWCKTSEEETLLHRACINGQLEMSKHLVQTYPTMLHEVDNETSTPAHYAAESGNIALLSYLIDCGTDPLCKTSEEETLLHRACMRGNLEMSKHLVQTYPTMLHEMDNMKQTPAHNAAHSGNIALLSYLIDCGTDPLCKTSEEETLLHRACINGQLEMSKHLVQTYPTMLHEVDNKTRTPAHNAAHSGNITLLSYLIDCGTDPWCKTSEEETLLHSACINGQLEMSKHLVQTYPTMLHEVDLKTRTPAHNAAHSGNIALLSYLIDRSADPWCKTSEEEALLHRACIHGQLEMSKHLVKTYPTMLHEVDNMRRTPAHQVAQDGNIALLSYLIDCGTDPWCKTSEDETLLHRACINGQLEMSKHLVQTYPTMLHEVDLKTRTPAHNAAHSGNIALLSYLIDCGTDPWCKTSEEETLLHRACMGGKLEMSKHLVQTYPTMLHEVDLKTRTPAHNAAHSGNIALLSYLIDCGTDPWCKTSEEETLLHRACMGGKLEMSKHLVQTYPTMLHEVDLKTRTPAHNAAHSGNIALLSNLIDCGTDPWCKTSEDETLLHRACIHGQLEMSKHLVQTYPTMLHEVDLKTRTPAHNAAHSGNIALLSYLIDCGTDPWCKTSEEETLLHRACMGGKLEMSKHLVQTYPTMLHEMDNMKQTPAHNAAHSGNIALLSYLIDCGTDPLCKTSEEETLLHRACINGQLEMSKHLVQTYPTMLHEVDNKTRTPAHNAAHSGNIALLSYLIDCGTDPWCKTSEEETLLHSACINGQLEMSKHLVQTYPTMLHEVDLKTRTPAHNAAHSGNIALLSYLIDRSADPWCKTSEEETLLHRACIHGQLEMSKHLVKTYPTMLHEVDNMRRTPAHQVAQDGNIALLSYLIDCGTDPWCKTSEDETLLHRACINGQLEMSKHLVQTYPTMLHEVDLKTRTPAHNAAHSGNIALLSYLIDCGTDPWCKTSEEETLLHRACMGGKLEMSKHLVQTYPTMLHEVDLKTRTPAHNAAHSGNIALLSYLIDCGTDPWCKTSEEETLLHRACMRGRLEMSKHLVQTYPTMLHEVDNKTRTPAHNAAHSGNIALLSYLIDCGTDPWCKTSEEETLLHRACMRGKLEMSKHLVQTYPTMLHEVDNMKKTPAHYAAESGNMALLSYLIDRSADPWCKTSEGETLLHRACINGQLEMSKHLVQTYPIMLHEVDNKTSTPAHYAAHSGNIALLSYLIDCGTDPWCKTSEEETLLHSACINGQLEMSKHLVQTYPTMLHEVDNKTRTPAHYAAHSGNIALLSNLIDCGTDPWCKTSEDETLLHRACIHGQLEMSKHLVQTYPTMLHEVDLKTRTPAHNAAHSGNIALLSYLIDCGTDPWCKTSEEETLLHRACMGGKLEMSKHLVQTYPTMLHEMDNMKQTPAHNAAHSGNIALLSYLIDCGTDPLCKTSEEETLLHRACINGQLEMSKHLVQTYPTMLHEVDNKTRTPAHNAAHSGNIALLSYLIDCGTDPWCKTSEEETLLHSACINGQLEMSKHLVQTYPTMLHEVDLKTRTPAHNAAHSGNIALLSYLIDRSADPWCKTYEEETLLHRACIHGQLEMSKHLVKTYPTMLHEVDNMRRTPAHQVAQDGNIALLSYLIDCGTDPWCKTSEDETLLHRACINGQLEMSKHLVQTYPTMLHEVDLKTRTPAHNAAHSGNIALLSYLIDCGTDPWCKTSEEETLLHRACMRGKLEMSKHLVQTYPTMLHEVDLKTRTPAHNAAHSGNIALLSYLIDCGTDPWCKTSEDETLLHRACMRGKLEMSKHLVQTYPTMLHEVDNKTRTPAHYAAHSGNIALLSYLIDCGTDPWCKTSEEETLLHRACMRGKLEMSKHLVQTYPTMLHEVDNMKKTPAHYAAESGNMALLSYLIDRSADPWCKTSEGETLLHRACINGQLEMSKHLVQTYPIMLHEVDNKTSTPAHYAAHSGNIALLSYLIDCGTDPWCKTSEEETLLHRACINGQLEMSKHLVKTYSTMLHDVDNMRRTPAHKVAYNGNIDFLSYLIDCGTDPWCKTSEDETLLHRACTNGQLEMSKHLVQTYPKMLHEVDNKTRTPAHNAAHSGNIALLSYLIDCGTDPWCKTSEEETLLHRACIHGQLEMSKHLVQTYPTMLHKVDNETSTPAHYAAESGNIALLSNLFDCGTDPWCKTSEEETLLHRACMRGKLEMSKHLVQTYPTMLHEVDNKTRTPAHNAAHSGNIALLSYLIDCGTDPWCKTSEEETLLHRACINGQLEMSKHLVQTYPTMLHEVDNETSTPAHYAAESGNIALLSYLIDCGTDPLCKTSEEETLLHRACMRGNLEMSKHLVQTYPTMLHEMDNMKQTPAHNAAHSGNIALLSYLIDCGTDPLCKTSEEETLLHRACINGQLEMSKHLVQTYPTMLHEVDNKTRTPAHNAAHSGNITLLSYLIDCGTDPWCKTSEEETLLHSACINGQLEMSKHLVQTYPTMLHEVDLKTRTPAHNAAHSGNIALLSYLIDRSADPWCKTSEEEALLHRACIHGQLEMSKHLVKTYPTMLHEVDNMRRTPAHQVAQDGNIALLSYLIDCGTDPWCKTSEDETLLHRACINGQLEMSKHLVQTYPTMLHEVDLKTRTPAHNAAHSGNIALLSYLIDCGTDPWCKTSEEETLLHRACMGGKLEMSKHLVQTYPTMLHEVDLKTRTPAHNAAHSGNIALLSYLIDCGTDPWCKTSEEETLLHRACMGGKLEMSKHLVQTYPTMLHEVDLKTRTPAHNAAHSGNITLLSNLIDCGTDPWCKTSEDETLLHRACIHGQLEMSKHLVQTYPTMLHEVDLKTRTPAHNAAHSGNIALLSYLIDCGTDPWCKTSEEETLLHRACMGGKLEMSKHLVQTYPTMLHEMDNMKQTPAHNAAHSGNIALLSYLIDCGTDPLCKTSEEETLLHRACINGQLEMSKHLVQTYPTMLHEVDNKTRTPAHNAAHSGNIALLSYLIDCGTDPWCKTSEEETLLHSACINGQLEMSKHLVQTYPTMLHEVDLKTRTPAHNAAHSGNIALLSYLIDRSADPWCKTSEEETLLHRACIHGQLEMSKHLVKTYPTMLHEVDNMRRTPAHQVAQDGNIALLSYLIDCGTDPWCKTSEDETLLHRACINGQLEMSKHLVQTYPTMLHEVDLKTRTPAHNAAHSGNIALLSYLIDCGTDPWCKTSEEETLLHRACMGGKLEMSKHLVQTYPTMLHEMDNMKQTPAHNAAHSGNIALLSYLIDCGTDPLCKTSEEETLLHRACINGQLEMSKHLVQTYPTMLHEVDNKTRTPAHNAAHSGNIALLSYLIDCGTDPWCKTSEEETLLHSACINGQLEMSKHLVQTYPTMLHEVDLKTRTPAHNAAHSGNIALLSYLIDRSADPWCKTSEEETLLHRACIHGQLEMSKHLVKTYPTMLHEVDNMRRTPAHQVAQDGNIALLSYLIDCGTDPWCKTSEDETLLHRACINGQLEMSKHLVQTYPTMLHEVDLKTRTPAHNAAHSGNIALLSYLIDCGTDPWCKTSEEETLLHRACMGGKLEMSKHLVQTYPTMLHEVDLKTRTPAHNAAHSGNIALLSYLIDCGTDPWCKTSEDETLLHRACMRGKLEMSKHLVQTYPTMLHEVDNKTRTPAHYAAHSGNIALLSYLIDCGTDPWCKTSEEETLLHRACMRGKLEMSKHLVQTYPTMLHEVDNMKKTPAHYAAESGNMALLSYLIDRSADPWCKTSEGETLLHRACINGQLEMSKHLVQTYPIMLHEVDNKTSTPAHYAAHSGNIALLSYLIDCGTDPWCKTSEEETLLHSACINGQLEMSKHLVQTYPIMLHEVDNKTRTPAHYAAHSGNIALLRYLIDCGTDPWCKTSEEEALLHRACIHGQLEMSKHLVQTYPTMLHEVDNKTRTPAHYAAKSGNIALLSYLIDCGTDPWCKTSEGETLLHRACMRGKLEMSKHLVQTYPTMLHEVDNMKKTPAHYAAESGNIALLSYLIDRGADPWCETSEEETLLHRACSVL